MSDMHERIANLDPDVVFAIYLTGYQSGIATGLMNPAPAPVTQDLAQRIGTREANRAYADPIHRDVILNALTNPDSRPVRLGPNP